jgi:CRP/FNR family transcriptional regulator, cyclic AMP receptor protein
MLTSTVITGICSIVVLLWWKSRLREAEVLSSFVMGRLNVIEDLSVAPPGLRLLESVDRRLSRESDANPCCDTQDIMRALRGIWLFGDLDERQVSMVADITHPLHVTRGEQIVTQGETDGGDLYCVLNGYFKVTTHGSRDREILINILQSGESFGEIGFLDRRAGRSATVTALADGQVLRISRADIERLLNESPKVAIAMLTAQSRLVRNLTERAEDNAFLDVRTRLAKRLVALADNLGTQVGPREVALKVRLSHQDLGDMIEATRKSVNECLSDWAKRGVIRRSDGRLIILDRQHLKDVAAGAA